MSLRVQKRHNKKKAVEESLGMIKHYPWLATFDEEAKSRLTTLEVSNVHVLKLLILMESHVSSEVSKLRNKPNRATKFLTQVRKRISMTKIGGYLIDPSLDHELFPTYGLLLTHVIDITLVSSKIDKLGAQQVASELYYFLKLVLHGDNQFVLDVILCSTLDEHASSQYKVGYQLFTFVIEDFRCYCDTHAGTMKYCAVASLLFNSCVEGRVFVERNFPLEMDKTLPNYLAKNLNMVVTPLKSKKATLKDVVRLINVSSVKSLSRSRLVIVSKKDISASKPSSSQRLSQDNSDSDAESTTSTVLNIPTQMKKEIPSSSSADWQDQSHTVDPFFNQKQDPVVSILGDLGIIDTGGVDVELLDDEDDEDTHTHLMQQESRVSSSSTPSNKRDHMKEARTLSAKDAQEEEEEEVEAVDDDAFSLPSNDGEDLLKDSITYDSDSDQSDKDHKENESRDIDVDKDGIRGVQEENELLNILEEPAGTEGSADNLSPCIPFKSKQKQTVEEDSQVAKTPLKNETLEDSDSDLEILSVKSNKMGDDDDDASYASSAGRDEADPESGEDYVPNYDIDSDLEEDQTPPTANGNNNVLNTAPACSNTFEKPIETQTNKEDNSNSLNQSATHHSPTLEDTDITDFSIASLSTTEGDKVEDKVNEIENNATANDTVSSESQSPGASSKSDGETNLSAAFDSAKTVTVSLSRNDIPPEVQNKRNTRQKSTTTPTPSKRIKFVIEPESESEGEEEEEILNDKNKDHIKRLTRTRGSIGGRGRKSTSFSSQGTNSPTVAATPPKTMVTRRCTRSTTCTTPRRNYSIYDIDTESSLSSLSGSNRSGSKTRKSASTPGTAVTRRGRKRRI